MDPEVIDLGALRRRLRAVSDETGALAALTDADLLWLLANGWEPPGVEVQRAANPATDSCFVLTTAQFHAYRQKVDDARAIKELLRIEERAAGLVGEGDGERVEILRAALRRCLADLQEMSAGWEPG